MSILNQIPDEAKLAASISPTALTLFGYPIEQWMYVASAIVSVMFVIEKIPIIITRIGQLIRFIKGK